MIVGSTELVTEGATMASEALSIPKIDFSGLIPGSTLGWDTVQSEVIKALQTFGCFEAIYDRVTPQLRESLFRRAIPELFSLPVATKNQNESSRAVKGYIQVNYLQYESLGFNAADVAEFTSLMWPQGNPSFCETICTYVKHLKELEQMIGLMVCRSLGIEKYYESYHQSTTYRFRLSEYGVPLDKETKISIPAHLDPNFVSTICQHEVEGLEVLTKEGEWIRVVPSPNSFTVMLGEAFEAWSNGRLSAPLHRVRLIGDRKRNTVLFDSVTKDEYIIQAPKELVDEEHPLLYMPYRYADYLKFRFSGEPGTKGLKDFCGVVEEL